MNTILLTILFDQQPKHTQRGRGEDLGSELDVPLGRELKLSLGGIPGGPDGVVLGTTLGLTMGTSQGEELGTELGMRTEMSWAQGEAWN
jgi:hypothetical protein